MRRWRAIKTLLGVSRVDMAYEFSRSKKSSTHGAKKGAKDPPQKNDPAPPSTGYPTLDDIRGSWKSLSRLS